MDLKDRKKKVIFPFLFQENSLLYRPRYAESIINWLLELSKSPLKTPNSSSGIGKTISSYFHNFVETLDTYLIDTVEEKDNTPSDSRLWFCKVDDSHATRFNSITELYRAVVEDPSIGPKLTDILMIIRDMDPKTRPNKAPFDHAFEINAELFRNGAMVAEPIAWLRDIERANQNEIYDELKKNGELNLEEMVSSITESSSEKEALIVRLLPNERLDRALYFMRTRLSQLEKKIDELSTKSVKSKRAKRDKALYELQVPIYRGAINSSIASAVESVVKNIYVGTYKCTLPEPKIPLDESYFKNEMVKNLHRLEVAAIKTYDPTINPRDLSMHKRANFFLDSVFSYTFEVLNDLNLFGFSHAEAVPHHFASDSDGSIKAFDFDKAQKNGILIWDLVTLINNVVLDSSYNERRKLFLGSLLYFAKLQLNDTFGYDGSNPSILSGPIKLSPCSSESIEELRHFEIKSKSTEKLSEILDPKQCNDLLNIFDILSAIYYPMLAGRASKFEYEDSDSHQNLIEPEIWGVSKKLSHVDLYVDAHYKELEKNLERFNKEHLLPYNLLGMDMDDFRLSLKPGIQISLKDVYGGDSVRKICAERTYEILDRLESRFNLLDDSDAIDNCYVSRNANAAFEEIVHNHNTKLRPLKIVRDLRLYLENLEVERVYNGNKMKFPVPHFNRNLKVD